MTGSEALDLLIRCGPPGSVLDLGAGNGEHAKAFADTGRLVVAVDFRGCRLTDAYVGAGKPVRWVTGDFLSLDFPLAAIVWSSHVLEHLPNVGAALAQMRSLIAPGGVLAVTVPPLKHSIVGGHVSLWNLGLLAYRLILAGFDCSRSAAFASYGYNLSAVCCVDEEVPRKVLSELRHDHGDINILAPHFPPAWEVRERFDGNTLANVNWETGP